MTTPTETRVALVSGASRGIGRHFCEHLLRQGCRVVGCSRGEAEWAAEGFIHYPADVTSEEQVRRLVRRVGQEHGRLDVLINNAGVASMNHVLLTPIETVKRIIDTNTVGTFLMCREAAKLMRKTPGGRIVNLGSAAVPLCLAGEAAYLASKAAVVSLTQVLAREFAEFGITVNCVGPAPTQTDMIRGVPKEKIDALLAMLPVKRLTTFEDLANVVDFFIKPESDAITGQLVYLGGAPNG